MLPSFLATIRFTRQCSLLLVLIAAFITNSTTITPAYAITLDDFSGFQQVTSQAGSNTTNRSVISSPTSVGGRRSLETVSTSGTVGILTATTPNINDRRLLHSQEVDVVGTTLIHWDGNSNANAIDFTGLGGISLTEDNGSAFILEDVVFDFAFGQAITIIVRAYDASDATGETYSEFTRTLSEPVLFADIMIPFDSQTSEGANGPADFNNVGALSLFVDGSNPGVDLSVDNLITNGDCPLTPGIGGSVLDECGECLAPSDPLYNQSCSDCVGVPNGETLAGDSCDTNELGPCAAGVFDEGCDCQRINQPTSETCDGADNNCNGEVDETFTQLGELCGIQLEQCEVTGAFTCSDTGGVKCDFDPNLANFDQCSEEIGCDGVPGSGALPDDCGVCGGDGSTCENLNCQSFDISPLLFELDGGAKEQEQLIRSITKIIRRNTAKKRIKAFTDVIRDEAHVLQIKNWTLTWTIPRVNVQCDSLLASEFCVQDDRNTTIVNEYIARSEELRDLGFQANKRLRKVTRKPTLARRWIKRLNKLHNNNLATASMVPETQDVCTTPTS